MKCLPKKPRKHTSPNINDKFNEELRNILQGDLTHGTKLGCLFLKACTHALYLSRMLKIQ